MCDLAICFQLQENDKPSILFILKEKKLKIMEKRKQNYALMCYPMHNIAILHSLAMFQSLIHKLTF